MWIVKVNNPKTTASQKSALDCIYGNNHFPRKFHYKREAEDCKKMAEKLSNATLIVEKG